MSVTDTNYMASFVNNINHLITKIKVLCVLLDYFKIELNIKTIYQDLYNETTQ